MTPSNYQMAHECLRNAESSVAERRATIEAMAAQTYATLALVDAIRDMRDTVANEVSDALIDMKGGAK